MKVPSLLLSNNDIKREIIKAKNISIHPLIVENIKGSSINLTASAHAWDVKQRDSVVSQDGKKGTFHCSNIHRRGNLGI